MKIQTDSVTLLRASHESFKGRDGNLVEYDKAILLDDEGNKFEMAISKDAGLDLSLEKVEGAATLEAFIARKDGQPIVKFRLLGFQPA